MAGRRWLKRLRESSRKKEWNEHEKPAGREISPEGVGQS
jgi:hypothetical protein